MVKSFSAFQVAGVCTNITFVAIRTFKFKKSFKYYHDLSEK